MAHRFLLSVFFLIILGNPANAWIDANGDPLEDTLARKSIGNFGAWLLLIDDEEKFYNEWIIPGTLNVDTVKKIKKNSYITALIIFSGCVENRVGNCKVWVDFHITQPNGKLYAKIPNQPLWIDRPRPKPGALQRGEAFIRIRIEPHEPLGTYRVRATIREENAKVTLTLENQFLAYAYE